MSRSIYDLTHADLTAHLAGQGWSHYHADQLWQALYRQRARSWEGVTGVRGEIIGRLQSEFSLAPPAILNAITSADGTTRKYLLRPGPDHAIETVIMAFRGRHTACISTQAGCAMGCVFCATGQMGFRRHLTPGEIVGQVLHVIDVLAAEGQTLRNIVLMGMGEPLHNYDHTMAALDTLMHPKGVAIAPRFITLSTVGLPDGIRRLADEGPPVRLAVSLHGASDAERQALVPPARKWPLAEVLAACRYYVEKRQRRIFFEWALIAGENDQPEQAHRLGHLLHGFPATINVIPLNPTGGYGGRPSDGEAVRRFTHILRSEYGLRCTVRQRRGIEIAAGCGQLAEMYPGREGDADGADSDGFSRMHTDATDNTDQNPSNRLHP
jgi:23S rRNA (adenine2503-C2)-methyltransferase